MAYTDAKEHVWLGLTTGELALYEGDKFLVYSTKDGLFPGKINTLLSDSKGDLWVGGSGGLSRFKDGRFQTLTQQNGFAFR